VHEIHTDINRLDSDYDAIIDATNSPSVPSEALSIVEPGGRVVYIGVSGVPALSIQGHLFLKT